MSKMTFENEYNLDMKQVITACRQYVKRKEYQDIRNQREDVIDYRRTYMRNRSRESSRLLKLYKAGKITIND